MIHDMNKMLPIFDGGVRGVCQETCAFQTGANLTQIHELHTMHRRHPSNCYFLWHFINVNITIYEMIYTMS